MIFFKHPYSKMSFSSVGAVASFKVSEISIDFTYLSNSLNVYSISPLGNSLSVYTLRLGLALTSISHALKFSSINISIPNI
jgi:hypothetical protein